MRYVFCRAGLLAEHCHALFCLRLVEVHAGLIKSLLLLCVQFKRLPEMSLCPRKKIHHNLLIQDIVDSFPVDLFIAIEMALSRYNLWRYALQSRICPPMALLCYVFISEEFDDPIADEVEEFVSFAEIELVLS